MGRVYIYNGYSKVIILNGDYDYDKVVIVKGLIRSLSKLEWRDDGVRDKAR